MKLHLLTAFFVLSGAALAFDGYTQNDQWPNDITFTGNETPIRLSTVMEESGAQWNSGGSIYWGSNGAAINLIVDVDARPWRIKEESSDVAAPSSITLTFEGAGALTSAGSDNNFTFGGASSITLNLGLSGSISTGLAMDLHSGSTKLNLTTSTNPLTLSGLYTRDLLSASSIWYSTDVLDEGNLSFSDAALEAAGFTFRGIHYADDEGNLYTGVTKDGWGTVTGLDTNTLVGTLGDHEYALVLKDNASKFSLMSYVIPEPATATLSLLALAGLAARRRRK